MSNFTWSFSALECFGQCPKKYYHQYILKEKSPPSPELIRGRELHKVCEDFLKTGVLTSVSLPAYALLKSVARQAKGKKLHVEQQMGLLGNFEPSGFFDPHVWGRAAADVIIVDAPNAMLIDWKTGKNKEGGAYDKGPEQLRVLAMFIFKHFPRIDKVSACNIYLDLNEVGRLTVFERDKEHEYWTWLLPKIKAVEEAIAQNQFCTVPGQLCRFCPVLTCPNNRS